MVLKDLKRIGSKYCKVEVSVATRKQSDPRKSFVKVFNSLRKIPAKYNNLEVVYLTFGVSMLTCEKMVCLDCYYPEED